MIDELSDERERGWNLWAGRIGDGEGLAFWAVRLRIWRNTQRAAEVQIWIGQVADQPRVQLIRGRADMIEEEAWNRSAAYSHIRHMPTGCGRIGLAHNPRHHHRIEAR